MSQPSLNGEQMFRAHDLAIMNWIAGLDVDYGTVGGTARTATPILAVFSTPDRAFAQVADLLVARGWINGSTDAERRANAAEYEVLPTPFVSVWRADPVPDSMMAGVQRSVSYRDPSTGQTALHGYPRFYWCDYTLSFFAQKTYTDNYLREWFMGQFGVPGCAYNERVIPVVRTDPWSTQNQALRFQSFADASNLEGIDPRYRRFDGVVSLRMVLIPNAPR